ncbi:hypothetical protein K4H03_24410, partial [Mycobacterium tuberculosis]|nr:hypothetical protein [Mycobacterium tuberculosis]
AYHGSVRYSGLNYGPYSQTSAETKFVVQTSAGPSLRLIGANAFKRDGTSNWNEAQCYSDRGFESGAFCSFSPTNNNCYFMAGLNSDPLTNPDYTSLD